MLQAWRELDQRQWFVWNKLISGAFRVGVSQQLITRALGEVARIDPAVIAHRLMGDWEPSPIFSPNWLHTTLRRRHEPPLSVLSGHALDEAC